MVIADDKLTSAIVADKRACLIRPCRTLSIAFLIPTRAETVKAKIMDAEFPATAGASTQLAISDFAPAQ